MLKFDPNAPEEPKREAEAITLDPDMPADHARTLNEIADFYKTARERGETVEQIIIMTTTNKGVVGLSAVGIEDFVHTMRISAQGWLSFNALRESLGIQCDCPKCRKERGEK